MIDDIDLIEEETINIELDTDIVPLGDMLKEVYDTNNNGIVDNAEKVNNHTVEADVPEDAVFTDTIYDDTEIKQDISNIKQEQTTQNTNIQTNAANISSLQTNKADKSEIPDVSNFITKDVNNLTYYTLKTSTGSLIDLEVNSSTYVVTLYLKDIDGNVISTDTIDLPLESVVVSGSFDSINKKIVLTLQNGNTVDIPVGDLVAGLQTEITSTNKLNADYVDDTNSGNKFTNTTEKTTWNAKYDKPSGGIPSTDLTSAVQTSLGKADTAIQNTDYANASTGGVFKTSNSYGTNVNNNGILQTTVRTYEQYSNAVDNIFIGKGTLENVITGKGLVSNTDYATDNVGGVIKTSTNYGTVVNANGTMYVQNKTLSQYEASGNNLFIGKGTLENVLNARIGNIATVLDNINGEVI